MSRHKARGKWRVHWIVGGHQCPGKSFDAKSEARGYADAKLKTFPDSAEGYKLVKEF